MPLTIHNISVMDLSKSTLSPESDLKYAISQYQYHLNELYVALKEMNHHLDKCNEWVYLVEKFSKNLNR